MAPEEAKKRLFILAQKMDKNGDGNVDAEELKLWILSSLSSLDEAESSRRFASHDQDEDGKLGWDEYLKSFYGFVPNPESPPSSFTKTEVAQLKQLFTEDKARFTDADVDSDGILTTKEFVAFARPEDFEHTRENLAKRRLADADKDGDGAVDLEEFLGTVSEEEWRAVETDRFLRGLDADGDGKLQGDEIHSWAIPSSASIAGDEASHLLHVADADGNALLTPKEIVEHAQLFVGSAATAFGEHLRDEL